MCNRINLTFFVDGNEKHSVDISRLFRRNLFSVKSATEGQTSGFFKSELFSVKIEIHSNIYHKMVLHILMRSIGIIVVGTVCFLSISNGISLFVWHPILMSVGVSKFMRNSLTRSKIN